MPVKLESENELITPSQMQDGQIGVIVKNDVQPESIGRIVQHNQDRLVAIGLTYLNSFYLSKEKSSYSTMRVRILPPGTLLRVE